MGRESRALHGEPWAARREILPNPHQFRAPVSAVGDDGEVLPGVVGYDSFGLPGDGDGKVQSYCYRLCLSRAEDRSPLAAPAGYDPKRFTVLTRYFDALAPQGIPANLRDAIGISELPNGKADVNSHGPVSTNLLGAAWWYPTAEPAARRAIENAHREWAQGLLHFLATDSSVPGIIADEVGRYGPRAGTSRSMTSIWMHSERGSKRAARSFVRHEPSRADAGKLHF